MVSVYQKCVVFLLEMLYNTLRLNSSQRKNVFLLEGILWRPILPSRVVTTRMKWHKLQKILWNKLWRRDFTRPRSSVLVFQWVTEIREKGAKSRVFHFTRAMPIPVTKRKVTAKKHRKGNNKGKLTGVKVTRSEEETFIKANRGFQTVLHRLIHWFTGSSSRFLKLPLWLIKYGASTQRYL